MIQTVCTNVTKRLNHLFSSFPRMTLRGAISPSVTVCYPVHGLFSNCPSSLQAAAVRSVTLRSLYSTTVASSLYNFRGKSACRDRSPALRGQCLWPMTVQRLQCKSTSAAPDVFPKRTTRRTKKKDAVYQSEVGQNRNGV